MDFPERFSTLPEYAFPRLRALLDSHAPGGAPLAMSIGEPQHAFPAFVSEALAEAMPLFNKYPPNDGSPDLLAAIGDWIAGRYGVTVDPATQVLALNGTREGLFAACLALCPDRKAGATPRVAMPNPFYQVYAVGAKAAGAEPLFVNATRDTGFLPDFTTLSEAELDETAIAYVCSPSNPQGAVADAAYWRALLTLAERHDFYVFADECYSEVYRNTPPPGALQIATEMGVDPDRVVIFHSLSKRSNLPGLRSGFAAGGPRAMAELKKLRAYAGAPLPGPLQAVAAKVWRDEAHVVENRALYAAKFDRADAVFADLPAYVSPSAGFFLWLPVPDGEAAALKLWTETGLRVLPGAYLSRDTDRGNPGKGFIRVALVAPAEDVDRGLIHIRDCLYS
ncbi:aminotransferase class I/II-fold pyridoxal phosphate-dependent enzyme [Dinoroseobacter sp. S124A]|uniref:aminotransferase class I/II-fold pyridoxal phosphate-dependent enzyme n=1 Tax=Dinoroseobacter sp. S124A TaxID=3415128 RepID=UPI003C7CC248